VAAAQSEEATAPHEAAEVVGAQPEALGIADVEDAIGLDLAQLHLRIVGEVRIRSGGLSTGSAGAGSARLATARRTRR
jgi:hypothetical protein